MTLEELAHWIADTGCGGRALAPGGLKWNAIHDRALDALNQAYEMGQASRTRSIAPADIVRVPAEG